MEYVAKRRQPEPIEGELYRFVDGMFEHVEKAPDDGSERLKISAQAELALTQVRRAATKALGRRPQRHQVVEALIEAYATEVPPSDLAHVMRAYFDRLQQRRATGR